MIEDHRREERLSAEVKVDYRADGSFVTDYSANLSRNGIFVLTSHPLPVGEKVRLRLQLPGGEAPFALDGLVKWNCTVREKERHAPGMGIQFVDLPEGVYEKIDRLVREVGRESPHAFEVGPR